MQLTAAGKYLDRAVFGHQCLSRSHKIQFVTNLGRCWEPAKFDQNLVNFAGISTIFTKKRSQSHSFGQIFYVSCQSSSGAAPGQFRINTQPFSASQTKIAEIPAKFGEISSNFAGECSQTQGFPSPGGSGAVGMPSASQESTRGRLP